MSFGNFFILAVVFMISAGAGMSVMPAISDTDASIQPTLVPTQATAAAGVTNTGTTAGTTDGSVSQNEVDTVQTTPVPTSQPDDPIIGTWTGSKTVLFVYSGSGTITFRNDYTASASGTVKGPGIGEKSFSTEDLVWENLGGGKYRGSFGGKTLDFTISQNKLTATANPKKLGLMDALDMDITVDFTKL